MKHIIYTHNGIVKEAEKDWSVERIESVLNRLGASHWEIGVKL